MKARLLPKRKTLGHDGNRGSATREPAPTARRRRTKARLFRKRDGLGQNRIFGSGLADSSSRPGGAR